MRRVSDGELDDFLKRGELPKPLSAFAADMAFDLLDCFAEIQIKNQLLIDFAKKYGKPKEGDNGVPSGA